MSVNIFKSETFALIGKFTEEQKSLLVDEDVIFYDGFNWLTDNEPLMWEPLLREYTPHIKGEDISVSVSQCLN